MELPKCNSSITIENQDDGDGRIEDGLGQQRQVDPHREGTQGPRKDQVQTGISLLTQQKEIEQTIQYEMKMEEIRKGNEEKMKAQHEKEEHKKKELEERRKQEEAAKLLVEEEAKRKQEEEVRAQQHRF